MSESRISTFKYRRTLLRAAMGYAMRSSPRSFRPTLLLVLAGMAQSIAEAQTPPKPSFVETYVAKGPGGLSMRLQLLKPLATLPPSGWMNSAEEAAADGKFGSSVK